MLGPDVCMGETGVKYRWWFFLIVACGLTARVCAIPEVVGLSDSLAERYDLTWDLTANPLPASALVLNVEAISGGMGYQLRIEKGVASWQQTNSKTAAFTPVKAPVTLVAGKCTNFSLKRRPGTIALLQDHRLLFCAPAPTPTQGKLEFAPLPAGCAIAEARYQEMGKPIFGDDFMRPEMLRRMPTPQKPWTEDDTWKVAYYRKDNPADDPRDPATGTAMTTPWQLSLYPTYQTTTNGFWFLYRGVGPSWVVANPTMVYPTWDQYFVEATVKTEYDSTVGVIAAYQNNKNYLLFRWRQREYVPSGKPRAELIAVINGEQKILATGQRGFEPGQWYRLRLNLGWQTVQALIDGEVVMQSGNPGTIEGRVGLYADGAEAPRRLKVDEVTASMYVTTDAATGRVVNDAADAMRTTSVIYFDDIRVGEWLSYQGSLADSPFAITTTGRWKRQDNAYLPTTTGTMLIGADTWSRYSASTMVKTTRLSDSAGMLFHLDAKGNGYAWTLSSYGQKLQTVVGGVPKQEIERSQIGLKKGEWAYLRVVADGPYVRLFYNNQPVMENFDATRTAGRCGFNASTPNTLYSPLTVTQTEPHRKKPDIHDVFEKDRWLVTWASAEADWYPTFKPKAYVTPAGVPHATVGEAAPLPTDQPGIYWHKGGHYHDLRVILPVTRDTVADQVLYLAGNYDAVNGYQVQLSKDGDNGTARLLRGTQSIGLYPFRITAKTRLIFQRLGSYLVLTGQELDTEDTLGEPEVLHEQVVFAYHDRTPLPAEMIGFKVTVPALPAAQVLVESDRVEDTFETSPSGWISESGVWAVMARYSCQPQWNWFGGYGGNTPTVWNKYRLEGNQTVEAYMGIKMQYDNAPEEYARRYRDTNVTICADGSHLNTGYTVIRGGHTGKGIATILLRKGVEVQRTTDQAHLIPAQGVGHRRWFVTRIEKRGGEIKVFLDNKLAITYLDPDPIPGGYAGIWTLNNGIMLGRVNLSAQKMSVGSPRPAAPLAIQENLVPLPVPQVTVNSTPVSVATFESGLEECKERTGLTGRLVRERTVNAAGEANTFLKVVNTYPAGDFAMSLMTAGRNLAITPLLHFDYCFDAGVQVNLYLRRQNTWYEFLLTGKEAQEANVFTAGRVTASADGQWHHLEADLGALLAQAIARQSGAAAPATAPDLSVQEVVIADWSATPDARLYGFGNNFGGQAIRFDNLAFMPRVTSPVTLSWKGLADTTLWRTSIDGMSNGAATTVVTTATLSTPLNNSRRFFHLQGKSADGKWSPVVHVPLNMLTSAK